MKQGLTFDDVLILPGHSNIKSRVDISIENEFLGISMYYPIISANMDYVTGFRMAVAMRRAGAFYVLHRFYPWEDTLNELRSLASYAYPVSFSIGARDIDKELAKVEQVQKICASLAPVIVTVDVAHGHHSNVYELVKQLKSLEVKVIAGNVATGSGFQYLASAGADAIKVGIGPGSVCTTRTVTGVGVPQLTAILDAAYIREDYPHVGIIADGGIKNSGDMVKALAAGADMVMLGSLLAGTNETPGERRVDINGKIWYPYRGQSIFGTNKANYTPEGIEGWVESKGPVEDVLDRLAGGLISGLSYVGAYNLKELRENVEFVQVSPSTRLETETRVITNIS